MLSISSMAVAAMLGSACGTNNTNVNGCSQALYNQKGNAQNVCDQKGGLDLERILSQKGVSLKSGGNCRGTSCNAGSCNKGSFGMGF